MDGGLNEPNDVRVAVPVALSAKLTSAGGGSDVIYRGVHQISGLMGRPVLTVSRKPGGVIVSVYSSETSETVSAWIQDL